MQYTMRKSSAIGRHVNANSNKIMVARECKRSRNVADLCQERMELCRVNMRVRRVVRRSVVDDSNGAGWFRGEGACWWLVGISDSSGVEIRRTISAAGPGSEGSAIEKEGETLSEGAVPLCRRGRGTQVVHGLHTDARPGGRSRRTCHIQGRRTRCRDVAKVSTILLLLGETIH